jgi:UDP-GlcNAc:undecaprenyl-phosphate GlcNAc-1-phosphate transferase
MTLVFLLFLFAFNSILNCLIIFLWHNKVAFKIKAPKYQSLHSIHDSDIPRLGGAVLIFSLINLIAFAPSFREILMLKMIIFSLVPVILVGLKEDIFHNVTPITRLTSIFLTAGLFLFNYSGPLPDLSGIPYLTHLISNHSHLILFYIICLATLANGMNLIDGANGLCAAAALSILVGLLYLSHIKDDILMERVILFIIMPLIPFLILNYFYGKIFLGDLGAYGLGLILGMLTIILFSRHSDIPPHNAPLLLIYPIIEVIFTCARRLVTKKNIFEADQLHLHSKLFFILRSKKNIKKNANLFVAPLMALFWLMPIFTFQLIPNKSILNVSLVYIVFIIFYLITYVCLTLRET